MEASKCQDLQLANRADGVKFKSECPLASDSGRARKKQ